MPVASVKTVFQDTVRTTATHRKNVAALLKLQTKLDHKSFLSSFEECVLHILLSNKGHAEADRVIKFINAYLESLSADPTGQADLSIITTTLLPLALKGLGSALKCVRYRSLQVLTSALNNLDEISDGLFLDIKESLIERLRDKEATVRAGAAIGLCRLQEGSDEADTNQIQQHLVHLIEHDPSSEVRKNILWNIAINEQSMGSLLSRSHDVDASIRKLLYVRLSVSEIHYSVLGCKERIEFLQNGLLDRDLGTRTACMKLLCDTWLVQMGGMDKFVESLDVQNSVKESSTILVALFKHDHGLQFSSNDVDWHNLTPQLVFFIRCYAEHSKQTENDIAIDNLVPSLLDFLAVLEHYMHLIINSADEAEKFRYEFILQELIKMCFYIDLSDEIGRRKLDDFLNSVLVETDLPAAINTHVVRLGLKVALESVYINRLSTLLSDIRVRHGLTSTPHFPVPNGDALEPNVEWDIEESIATLKCLEILHCLFQLLDFKCPEYPAIYQLLEEIVFPCMSCTIPAISELALMCLTQCTLIYPVMALENIDVFIGFLTLADQRATICFQYFTDFILRYGVESLNDKQAEVKTLLRRFLQSESGTTLSFAAEGYCKMLLLDRLEDSEALLALLILYYHPSTVNLPQLRQSLSYFFPMYGHSNPGQLKEIFVRSLLTFSEMSKLTSCNMLQPAVIGSHILDWIRTSPQGAKSIGIDDNRHDADIALGCLTSAIDGSPANRRLFCMLMSKLQLPRDLSPGVQKELEDLVVKLQSVVSDLPSLNAIKKFHKTFQPLDPPDRDLSADDNDMTNVGHSVSNMAL
ncbi:hypothetical protein BASA50_001056 [Batrachochytrium salamandrivorans]|uniref:Nuclear condensin complex subunit 3 C-terminal domain-containing protein n=1 Tax=Batrachochytrium salamandrivorans TaxID=1357716 RepID=A0ABQ8ES78_9FUNG|nr:hypothetical protein BASA50_001056 [Batrachochytrium salamandrivorans]KAH6588215.1 hypothetical protein BASA61_006024 [Batrachochytrium salamandrivorans]KAH9273941.1 hypothetical protein BASA83_003573 [Batrachochytrium salamandrivorans]